MLVTLPGIVMFVKPVQPENAPQPILVTLSGIVMLVKLVQFLNLELAIPVTLFPITTLFSFGYDGKSNPFNEDTPFPVLILVNPVQP